MLVRSFRWSIMRRAIYTADRQGSHPMVDVTQTVDGLTGRVERAWIRAHSPVASPAEARVYARMLQAAADIAERWNEDEGKMPAETGAFPPEGEPVVSEMEV